MENPEKPITMLLIPAKEWEIIQLKLSDLSDKLDKFSIQNNPSKQFLSPKEFQHLTGIPYSTVIYKCKMGKLKARQEELKGSWLIDATEVDRYKREAAENI